MEEWNMRTAQTDALTVFRTKSANGCFYCRAKRKEVDMESCINDFVTANAFERKRSACYRCHQGRKTREEFAGSYAGD